MTEEGGVDIKSTPPVAGKAAGDASLWLGTYRQQAAASAGDAAAGLTVSIFEVSLAGERWREVE